MSARPASLGFTLIEVMIAVVILAVGLSSLFTSEAGAVRIAQRARNTTVATLLARCKMAEIEERIGKEGWPGEQIDGRDECCDEAEHEGFRERGLDQLLQRALPQGFRKRACLADRAGARAHRIALFAFGGTCEHGSSGLASCAPSP